MLGTKCSVCALVILWFLVLLQQEPSIKQQQQHTNEQTLE